MAWTLTSRNFSEGTYSAGANVGDTFTPAENDIIVVFNVANDATAHTTVTGWGATWTQILAPSGTLNYSIWAARMGASPGSSQANIDFGGGSINYCAGVIQIAGAHTTAAIGVGGSNLFRQVTPLTTYDPASPYSATALSAFASATNLALTLAGISANLPLAPKAGFTELLEASGATFNPNVYASYKTSSDTAHQVSEATAGDFDFKNLAIIAIEMLEASSAPPVLSSPTPSGTLGTATTATLGATTDTTSGTLYTVVESTSALLTAITVAQIKAGDNNLGSAADASGSAAVSTTTPSANVTGLVAATAYYYATYQEAASGDSNIVTGSFTTAASISAKPAYAYAQQ